MNLQQAAQANELTSCVVSLAISKLQASADDNKGKYELLEKQQIELQKQTAKLVEEIESGF